MRPFGISRLGALSRRPLTCRPCAKRFRSYGIAMDAADGLLQAGEEGVQLTWMDAKVGDWVVTPRRGKPVEINALWFNALKCMALFARRLGVPAEGYDALAEKLRQGFQRFIDPAAGTLFDVLDGPEGADESLRPNQILAVSLPFSPLAEKTQRTVVRSCGEVLLTSYGLRSLTPEHPAPITGAGCGNAMGLITQAPSGSGCWAITPWRSIA